MDTKKFLSLIVIFSIAIMLSFSMLPAMADHFEERPKGECPGNGNGPWVMGTVDPRSGVDRNGNGHVCINLTPGGNMIIKDDKISKK